VLLRFAQKSFVAGLTSRNGKQERTTATKSTLSLVYRLAIENRKAVMNPARLLKRKREDNGRVRFLGQFQPTKTELDYLRQHTDEESRLRAVIRAKFPSHMPELEIALQTGMRPSEQFGLTWDRVDLVRKLVTISKSKNGFARHIPLNSVHSWLSMSCLVDLRARVQFLLIFMESL